ncbi:MAG: iron-containing alcohol dehydrogenase [bacterium]|nr:iron-containing alcohol dehydrogenase [bacterium]
MGAQEMKFTFLNPTKLVFGHQSSSRLGEELKALGVKKALLVTDQNLRARTRIPETISAAAGDLLGGIFSEVIPDSGIEIVNRGAACAREHGCDGIISLGGGSSIDTAKGIAVLLTLGQADISPLLGFQTVRRPMIPHVSIPTTAGTGSEATFVAVFKNESLGKKVLLTDDHLHPQTAILDPGLTLALPPDITAGTGMDAASHAIEAIHSRRSNPVSDGLALQALRLISGSLSACVNDGQNLAARGNQLLASTLAGIAFSNALVGVVHALAHALGARFGVPHGVANAICLAPSMRYNLKAVAPRYALIAGALGISPENRSDTELAVKTIEWVEKLLSGLPIPRKLRDIPIPREALPLLAEDALTDTSIYTNPVKITDPAELEKILQEAW